jgi:hypothetical protein
MTSIGTLFAFVIVCAAVWVMRLRSSGYAAAVSHTLDPASPGSRNIMEFRHDVFTWFEQLGAIDLLVSHWPGNLLHIQPLS